MAFTDACDAFASVHEEGMNRIGLHVMRQRPSLFNYATAPFAANTELLCRRVEAHPEVLRRGNPLVTVEDPLPILGTDGAFGLHFCLQLTKMRLDFHPGDTVDLPPELGSLEEQRVALHLEACGGIACPDAEIADRYGDLVATRQRPDEPRKDEREPDRPPLTPLPPGRIDCFCLDLFATLHVEVLGTAGVPRLALRLGGLEIVDIRPEGLENSLECYLATVLRVGLLPRLRIALDTLVLELGEFATLTVGPTPISGAVPHNPAIEDDRLKAFVNVGVSP